MSAKFPEFTKAGKKRRPPGKKKADGPLLKSTETLSEGDIIAFSGGENKILAEVVSIPPQQARPILVYRILEVGTIGVLNLLRASVTRVEKSKFGLIQGELATPLEQAGSHTL